MITIASKRLQRRQQARQRAQEQERGCQSKKAYLTKEEALDAASTARARSRHQIDAYKCHFEPHYHIGHPHLAEHQ